MPSSNHEMLSKQSRFGVGQVVLAGCIAVVMAGLIAYPNVGLALHHPFVQPSPSVQTLHRQSMTNERPMPMCNSTISAQELNKISITVSDVLRQINSFEELEAWFQAQSGVVSTNSPDYLIKTAPPRKELVVQFRLEDGSTVTKVFAIVLYPDRTLDLADVYDP